MWPTVAGFFAPHWPHGPQAPAQPPESPSGLGLVARLPISLQRHRPPCLNDAYLRIQQCDWTFLPALGDMYRKTV